MAPAELEALLLEHPLILDAAVIGAKGLVLSSVFRILQSLTSNRPGEDEYPRAYVVRRKEGSVTEKEIEQYVNSKVSKVKRLTGGVVFAESIPKNPVRLSNLRCFLC